MIEVRTIILVFGGIFESLTKAVYIYVRYDFLQIPMTELILHTITYMEGYRSLREA